MEPLEHPNKMWSSFLLNYLSFLWNSTYLQLIHSFNKCWLSVNGDELCICDRCWDSSGPCSGICISCGRLAVGRFHAWGPVFLVHILLLSSWSHLVQFYISEHQCLPPKTPGKLQLPEPTGSMASSCFPAGTVLVDIWIFFHYRGTEPGWPCW